MNYTLLKLFQRYAVISRPLLVLTLLIGSWLLLSREAIAQTNPEIPAPKHQLSFSEGSGNIVTDLVTGNQLAAVDSSINWCEGSVKGLDQQSFVKTGVNYGNSGLVSGTLYEGAYSTWTVSLLTRITDLGGGAVFTPYGRTPHLRFWNGTWDFGGGPAADPSLVSVNTWVRVTYVQTVDTRRIYIDDQLAGEAAGHTPLPGGELLLGAYRVGGNFYPGEYTDIRIWDLPLTTEEVAVLNAEDGLAGEFSVLNDGDDFAGAYKREEHEGIYESLITAEDGIYRHWFNGDTCWGGLSHFIPEGNESLWFAADFLYPEILSANHDLGPTVQTIALFSHTGRTDYLAALFLNHDEVTQELTLGHIVYQPAAGSTISVPLDGRTIDKGIWQSFVVHYEQGEAGQIEFYLNNELLHTVTENLNLPVRQAMFGLNMGIHPEDEGNVIYSDNLYSGVAPVEINVSPVVVVETPEPVYYLPMDEGAGTSVTDAVTGSQLWSMDDSINWAESEIKGQGARSIIKSGRNFGDAGVLQGSLITQSLPEYSISFLTRITEIGSGAIFNPLGSGLHMRFWNGSWDFAGIVATDSSLTNYGAWQRVTFVQSLENRQIYVDGILAAEAPGNSPLPAGELRVGAYIAGNFYYPGEYTDIAIYDAALTREQVTTLVENDGESELFAQFNNGTDFGGIYKREEHAGGMESTITLENGFYRHWFNGDACWAAISHLIPDEQESLWFSADFVYPENLTANHDYGTTAQTIAIYDDYGRSNPVAILLLDHDENTNLLTLGRVNFQASEGVTQTIPLDGRIIEKGRAHTIEMNYVQGQDGLLAVYLDGEELASISANFELPVRQVMFGFNQGIHPEVPGDVIYSTNLYSGEISLDEYINLNRVPLPDPIHYISLQEGEGTVVTDSVTGTELSGIDTSVNWASDGIRERGEMALIKSGRNFANTGIIEGDLLENTYSQWSISFLTRITESGQGAIFNPLSSGLHMRFWAGRWDIAGVVAADTALVKYNTWQRITYVQTADTRQIYVDGELAGEAPGNSPLPAGILRIGAYVPGNYYYPGEYTDISIFDAALTTEQIGQLVTDDGESETFVQFNNGNDFGGIWKREEHYGGMESTITLDNGLYQHWFNGDACWGAITHLVPEGKDELYFAADFYYPGNLTANHDYGSTAQTIAIYDDWERSSPIAILLLNHDEIANELTLGRISYQTSAGVVTTVILDGRVIEKDVFHHVEMDYVSGVDGLLAVRLNGEELLRVVDSFQLETRQAMFGLNQGIHPETPGDRIYSTNIYSGEISQSEYLYGPSVDLPEPRHLLTLQEGQGTVVTDQITGAALQAVDSSINWAEDTILDRGSLSFIKSGRNFGNAGVIQGSLMVEAYPEYTITFLTRIMETTSGAIFNPLGSGLHMRFWNGTWDIAGIVSADPSLVKYGTWQRVSYVQTASARQIFVDDVLAGQVAGNSPLPAGDIRIGAYIPGNYYYPGEYTDIAIYDCALAAEQIGQLVIDDGESGNFMQLNTGLNFGGIWKREEHAGEMDSVISLDNGVYRHWYNGDSCWGAITHIIPEGTESETLYFSADFYYPENLTANHDYGNTAQTIALYDDFERSSPIAILLLDHDETTQVLSLGRIQYQTESGTITTVTLDGREIMKGSFHTVEMEYTSGTSGHLSVKLNGEELLSLNTAFELEVRQAMFGLNQGIHPETPGDVIYSTNIYSGEVPLSE